MSSVPADFDTKKLADPKYKAEDFNINADLLDSPFENRKCTDVFCGIFFFLFLALMATMTGYGYAQG